MTRHTTQRVLMMLAALLLAAAGALAQGPSPAASPLDRLIDAAIADNPDLAVLRSRIDVAQAEVPQAGSLPDPRGMIALSNLPVGDLSLERSPMTGIQLGLQQMIPYPGRLDLKELAASQDVQITRAIYQEAENAVTREVKRTWDELYYLHRAVEVARLNKQLAQALAEVADALYSTGSRPQLDLIKANVEAARLVDRLVVLDEQIDRAEARLNALLNRPPDAPLPAPEVGFEPLDLSPQALEGVALQSRPLLLQAQAAVDKAKTMVRLAEMNRKPDFTLGLDYRIRAGSEMDSIGGQDMWSLSVGANLPWLNGDLHDAERVTGGYFIDFTPRREQAARYGLNAEDINAVVMGAIGGMNIDTTIEGPERYTINVRYGRELRDSLAKLATVLVPTPTGAQVPIGQLADIAITSGPPVIKNEDGSLTGWIYVDTTATDLGGYVARAKQAVADHVQIPAGYYVKWAGQYEFMERVRQRLTLVLPVTLFLIVLLLYLNFQQAGPTFIVLLSVPFAATGSIWAIYLLGYNMSIAVWVGIIALSGVAAETGVVMIVYLEEAYHDFVARGRMNTLEDLFDAITHGAVQRVRPKLMTVLTTLLGLLPLMAGHGAGADVAKRIAAPMVGGLFTSTVLTLEIIPAIYSIWRQRYLPHGPTDANLTAAPGGVPAARAASDKENPDDEPLD